MLENGIERVLISADEIQSMVQRLGSEITECYKGLDSEIVVIGLLRGSFIFMADLVRQIKHPLRTEFMTVSSYGSGTESSGEVKIDQDLSLSIEGCEVLLVEDIIDSGITLSKLVPILRARKPASLKICTLLNKPSRRKVDVEIDFCGCDIPDKFICGYGLDYAQKYRSLPYIGCLDLSLLEK